MCSKEWENYYKNTNYTWWQATMTSAGYPKSQLFNLHFNHGGTSQMAWCMQICKAENIFRLQSRLQSTCGTSQHQHYISKESVIHCGM